MSKFFDALIPADIIALFIIIGGFWLMYTGHDGVVGGCVIAVVAYYFGKVKRITS